MVPRVSEVARIFFVAAFLVLIALGPTFSGGASQTAQSGTTVVNGDVCTTCGITNTNKAVDKTVEVSKDGKTTVKEDESSPCRSGNEGTKEWKENDCDSRKGTTTAKGSGEAGDISLQCKDGEQCGPVSQGSGGASNPGAVEQYLASGDGRPAISPLPLQASPETLAAMHETFPEKVSFGDVQHAIAEQALRDSGNISPITSNVPGTTVDSTPPQAGQTTLNPELRSQIVALSPRTEELVGAGPHAYLSPTAGQSGFDVPSQTRNWLSTTEGTPPGTWRAQEVFGSTSIVDDIFADRDAALAAQKLGPESFVQYQRLVGEGMSPQQAYESLRTQSASLSPGDVPNQTNKPGTEVYGPPQPTQADIALGTLAAARETADRERAELERLRENGIFGQAQAWWRESNPWSEYRAALAAEKQAEQSYAVAYATAQQDPNALVISTEGEILQRPYGPIGEGQPVVFVDSEGNIQKTGTLSTNNAAALADMAGGYAPNPGRSLKTLEEAVAELNAPNTTFYPPQELATHVQDKPSPPPTPPASGPEVAVAPEVTSPPRPQNPPLASGGSSPQDSSQPVTPGGQPHQATAQNRDGSGPGRPAGSDPQSESAPSGTSGQNPTGAGGQAPGQGNAPAATPEEAYAGLAKQIPDTYARNQSDQGKVAAYCVGDGGCVDVATPVRDANGNPLTLDEAVRRGAEVVASAQATQLPPGALAPTQQEALTQELLQRLSNPGTGTSEERAYWERLLSGVERSTIVGALQGEDDRAVRAAEQIRQGIISSALSGQLSGPQLAALARAGGATEDSLKFNVKFDNAVETWINPEIAASWQGGTRVESVSLRDMANAAPGIYSNGAGSFLYDRDFSGTGIAARPSESGTAVADTGPASSELDMRGPAPQVGDTAARGGSATLDSRPDFIPIGTAPGKTTQPTIASIATGESRGTQSSGSSEGITGSGSTPPSPSTKNSGSGAPSGTGAESAGNSSAQQENPRTNDGTSSTGSGSPGTSKSDSQNTRPPGSGNGTGGTSGGQSSSDSHSSSSGSGSAGMGGSAGTQQPYPSGTRNPTQQPYPAPQYAAQGWTPFNYGNLSSTGSMPAPGSADSANVVPAPARIPAELTRLSNLSAQTNMTNTPLPTRTNPTIAIAAPAGGSPTPPPPTHEGTTPPERQRVDEPKKLPENIEIAPQPTKVVGDAGKQTAPTAGPRGQDAGVPPQDSGGTKTEPDQEPAEESPVVQQGPEAAQDVAVLTPSRSTAEGNGGIGTQVRETLGKAVAFAGKGTVCVVTAGFICPLTDAAQAAPGQPTYKGAPVALHQVPAESFDICNKYNNCGGHKFDGIAMDTIKNMVASTGAQIEAVRKCTDRGCADYMAYPSKSLWLAAEAIKRDTYCSGEGKCSMAEQDKKWAVTDSNWVVDRAGRLQALNRAGLTANDINKRFARGDFEAWMKLGMAVAAPEYQKYDVRSFLSDADIANARAALAKLGLGTPAGSAGAAAPQQIVSSILTNPEKVASALINQAAAQVPNTPQAAPVRAAISALQKALAPGQQPTARGATQTQPSSRPISYCIGTSGCDIGQDAYINALCQPDRGCGAQNLGTAPDASYPTEKPILDTEERASEYARQVVVAGTNSNGGKLVDIDNCQYAGPNGCGQLLGEIARWNTQNPNKTLIPMIKNPTLLAEKLGTSMAIQIFSAAAQSGGGAIIEPGAGSVAANDTLRKSAGFASAPLLFTTTPTQSSVLEQAIRELGAPNIGTSISSQTEGGGGYRDGQAGLPITISSGIQNQISTFAAAQPPVAFGTCDEAGKCAVLDPKTAAQVPAEQLQAFEVRTEKIVPISSRDPGLLNSFVQDGVRYSPRGSAQGYANQKKQEAQAALENNTRSGQLSSKLNTPVRVEGSGSTRPVYAQNQDGTRGQRIGSVHTQNDTQARIQALAQKAGVQLTEREGKFFTAQGTELTLRTVQTGTAPSLPSNGWLSGGAGFVARNAPFTYRGTGSTALLDTQKPTLIMHATQGNSTAGAIDTLRNRGLNYHVLVGSDAEKNVITNLRPVLERAAHLGRGQKVGFQGLNEGNTIGIACIAPTACSPNQMKAIAEVILPQLEERYPGISTRAFGHDEVSYKSDAEGRREATAVRNGLLEQVYGVSLGKTLEYQLVEVAADGTEILVGQPIPARDVAQIKGSAVFESTDAQGVSDGKTRVTLDALPNVGTADVKLVRDAEGNLALEYTYTPPQQPELANTNRFGANGNTPLGQQGYGAMQPWNAMRPAGQAPQPSSSGSMQPGGGSAGAGGQRPQATAQPAPTTQPTPAGQSGSGSTGAGTAMPGISNPSVSGGQTATGVSGERFSCAPGTVVNNSTTTPLVLTWSCPAGTRSVGYGFSTLGTNTGTTTIIVSTTSPTIRYELECFGSAKQERLSCTARVSHPAVTLIARPANVRTGESTELRWSAREVVSCELFTQQGTRIMRGGVSGEATTLPLTETTTFTATCATQGGETVSARATVPVR